MSSHAKRHPSGGLGSESPSKKGRRSKSSSDETAASDSTESSTSTAASGSTESSTFTKATTPGQDPQDANKMERDGTEDYSNYYQGLPGNPPLLARAGRPRTMPPMVYDDFADAYVRALKEVHPIGKHAIKNALENGLLDRIKEIMATLVPPKWTSIDFVRLGYSTISAECPAVILVTVQGGKVSKAEGERIAREIEASCIEMDVRDIDVEVMERGGPDDYSDYYHGLRGNPILLARADRPRTMPPMVFSDVAAAYVRAPKEVHPIGKHAIKNALENGLLDRIKGIMATLVPPKWISIDFVRIGFSNVAAECPAVILVTVEKDRVSKAEGERIVREIEASCTEMDVGDVDVEVKEGIRASLTELLIGEAEPLPYQDAVPPIGSSIALSNKHSEIKGGSGTLGGYVSVDGVIYGLTNHHVALSKYRNEPFPSESEQDTKLLINQPAENDLKRDLGGFERRILELEKELGSGDKLKDEVYRAEIAYMQGKVQRLKEMHCEDMIEIGHIYRSSGIRARDASKGPMHLLDWALIKIENSNRVAAPSQLVNRVPGYSLRYTCGRDYVHDAGVREGNSSLSAADLPRYLRRGLTVQEIRNIQASAEEKDRKYIVWKCGRTSNFTFGCTNSIDSLYTRYDGRILTQEWAVVDRNRQSAFCDYGDSGSLVWGSDGYVAGMIWGRVDAGFITYVTPIEVVLEDIKDVCGAKEVKLVVRPEEETDKVFGPPER